MATEKYPYNIRFNYQITEHNVEQDPELEQVVEFLDHLPKKQGRYSTMKSYFLELVKRDLKERYSPEAREFFESREEPNLSQTIASILTSLNDEKREEVAITLENLSDSKSMNDPGAILNVLRNAQLDNSTESYGQATQSAKEEEPAVPAASETADTAESSRPEDRADLSADVPVQENETPEKAATASETEENSSSQIRTAPSVKTKKEEKKTPSAAPKKSGSAPAWKRVNRSAGLSGEGNVNN